MDIEATGLERLIDPQGTLDIVAQGMELPCDLPMRVAFGDADLSSLYLTSGEGSLYRARNIGRRGAPRFARDA